jgi:hypothetical protein
MARLFMNIPITFTKGPRALEVKGACTYKLVEYGSCMVHLLYIIALPYSLP